MSIQKWELETPVLLIFFVRDELLERTFAAIRRARPKVLLLWQDGPRDQRDEDRILKCRQIVEQIDWECEVHHSYQSSNLGCDPSTHMAHRWAFSIVDRCIVLEDDVVAEPSFFTFCEELLEKYQDDERINRICGMNNLGTLDDWPYDYFFSSTGSVWGWATWKRVADTWDSEYSFLHDRRSMGLLEQGRGDTAFKEYLATCKRHAASGVPHWETIVSFSGFLSNRLNIVPTRNMIENIGLAPDSTHALSSVELLPRGIRSVFNMQTFTTVSPLSHPPFIVDHVSYRAGYLRKMAAGHPWIRRARKIESIVLRIRHRQWGSLRRGARRLFSGGRID